MPILSLDLPENGYRAALAVEPQERVRRFMKAFDLDEGDANSANTTDEPVLTEEELAAIGRGLEDIKVGRTIPIAVVFDRIRAKYGLRKGSSPL